MNDLEPSKTPNYQHPRMEQQTVLPQSTFRDTLAVLALLLALPPALSAAALAVYVLSVMSIGSHKVTAFVSRWLRGHSVEGDENHLTPSTSHRDREKEKDKEEKQTTKRSQIVFIALVDLFVCGILRFTGPWITWVMFVLAKALVAASISGDRLLRVFLAVLVVVGAEVVFGVLVEYLDAQWGVRVSQAQQLFPHFLPHYRSDYYLAHGFNFAVMAVNMLNLLLAVHVVLVAFASVFRTNFLSKSLNQLSANHDLPPTFTHLKYKDLTQSEFRVVQIELTEEQAQTPLILDAPHTCEADENSPPATYYENLESIHNPVSTDNVVAENFEVFCSTHSTRSKNHFQPLWTLIAAIKAMSSRRDIYSGERAADANSDNALVLSDYVNQYDDYMFSNFDGSGVFKERIRIFIDYIGETLISFQLQNYQEGDIIVRVNGVIWYQVSRGAHGDDTYFIVGGLTPLSQYDIQFIIEEGNSQGNKRKRLLDDLIVSTVAKGGEVIVSKPEGGASSKVLSPLDTLQESLITTNDNLAKERAKLKKNRKEITRKLTGYKTEIEQLKSKIQNADRYDEKHWKKILLLRNTVKQAEDDVAKVEKLTCELEVKENALLEVHIVEKRHFENLQRSYQQFKANYKGKIDVKREKLAQLNTELEALATKREKQKAKFEKLQKELENINTEILELCQNDLELRLRARAKRAEKRRALLSEFTKAIAKLEEGCVRLKEENEQLYGALMP